MAVMVLVDFEVTSTDSLASAVPTASMTTPNGRVSIVPVMTVGGAPPGPPGPPKPPPGRPPFGVGDSEQAANTKATASKVNRNRVTVSMMRGLLIKECPKSRGGGF